MKNVLLIVLALGCVFVNPIGSRAQENTDAEVPPHAMEQVVRRVLTWSFKPAKKRRVIFIADQFVQSSWLPQIENVEFRLVPSKEVDDDKKIYFFREPSVSNGVFEIGFVFGTLNCEYKGKSFKFRIVDQNVRLWIYADTGGGCARDKFPFVSGR